VADIFHRFTKRQVFMGIIALIIVLGVIVSLITKVTWITRDEDDFLRLAVVGPRTSDSAVIERSMRQGVELYADVVNEGGGIDDTNLAVDVYDDKNDPAEAKILAEEIAASNAQAVVGHWTSDTVAAAGTVYRDHGIQLISPASLDPQTLTDNEWVFSALFHDARQARFLANYARNVMGHKLVSMIVDKTRYGETFGENFRKTYRRFGTKIRYTWEFDTSKPVVPQMLRIVDELKEKKDAGLLFLGMGEIDGARMVKLIRDAGIRNMIVGPNHLATAAFRDAVERLPGKSPEPGVYSNRMLVTAPLLFDTANERAQNFKNRYLKKYGEEPDWVAAYAYDSAHLAVEALREARKDEEAAANISSTRQAIRDDLAGRMRRDEGIEGVTGRTFFGEDGEAKKPVFIGTYSGTDIVSALTQLQPIKPGGNRNYIAELKQGRVLYVNDRFMYKTNVVYTGLQVKEISEINTEENTFTSDFLIWFRYRGKFEPQDIKLLNAVDPIELEKPVDERQIGDMTYRLYRVKGKFRFNFSDTKRAYGDYLAGVAFSHNRLNKENLQYVVDVLGVGLNTGETMQDKLEADRALHPSTGWVIERAWISQDIVPEGTLGNPSYVGFASDDPDFSQIDFGIITKKGQIEARDFIPGEFFIYIGIFALIGTIFAVAMDRKERGRFWAAQSWILRLVCWPFLLLAGGNLGLDLSVQNLPDHYTDIFILVYDSLWWLIPARLLGIAMERFLWIPLKDHTERNIPNVIRVFGSVTIYSFAVCGIVAFVFDEALTSILASTGLLAMIIGLAVQANISNIFSGIVINMERPFNVGDWVMIGDVDEGRVVDITWRTTRVKVRNGYVVSIPNGQVSEAQIHNFNSFDTVRMEVPLSLDATYPMMEAAQIMEDAVAQAPDILDTPEREVRFKGVNWEFGWVAEYEIQFWIDQYARKEEIVEGALSVIWTALAQHGIKPCEESPDLVDERPGAVELSPAGE